MHINPIPEPRSPSVCGNSFHPLKSVGLYFGGHYITPSSLFPGSTPEVPLLSPANLYLEILYMRLERYLIAILLMNSTTPDINTCASNGEAAFSVKYAFFSVISRNLIGDCVCLCRRIAYKKSRDTFQHSSKGSLHNNCSRVLPYPKYIDLQCR